MKANELISAAAPGTAVTLPSGEFEGPLVISKPLRLIGRNTTIWAKNSPVIQINAEGVSIEDLRVEITEGTIEEPAVYAVSAASAKNIEVLGRVSGFGAEDGYFDIPRTIALGEFPANGENSFKLEVNVPAETEIRCELRELTFEPNRLKAGRNELIIKVNGISAQMFLYGEVIFASQFTRRVYITGRTDENAPQAVMKPVYTAPERDPNEPPPPPSRILEDIPEPVPQPTPAPAPAAAPSPAPAARPAAQPAYTAPAVQPAKTDVITMVGLQDPSLPHLDMRRGQRVGLTQYVGAKFDILFTASAPKGYEIDPYVFMLGDGDKAINDDSLVFFGNHESPDGSIRYYIEDGHVSIDLAQVSPQVKKIALTYSIYGGSVFKNFRRVFTPRIALCAGGERISYVINDLNDETTIVAMEFYLYKGEWKISAVGAGFKEGLAKLCNFYGIEVE